MRIVPASDSALLVSFGDAISAEAHHRVMSLFRTLKGMEDARIRNLHPAYSSLLIDFDPLRLTHNELAHLIAPLAEAASSHIPRDNPCTELPVCYDREFAPDLPAVAQYSGMTEEQVIKLHSKSNYFVYFLGFSPGFAYLGGLADCLHVPRLTTPRKRVIAGSVGLAGAQTGIYPNHSSGGWQLIGRTPLRMFDPHIDPPSRLQPGDRVRFRRIERDEFDRLLGEPSPDDPRH